MVSTRSAMDCGCTFVLCMEDIISVIIGYCDCGSDYKSWTLTCKLWMDTTTKKFPRANTTFGNKIIAVIDELSSLEFIRNCENTRNLLACNPYIPDDWKCKNGFDKYKRTLEIDCTKRGSKFTSVFDRPFGSDDEVIALCSKIVEDCDFELFGERVDVFHPTVSFKSIKYIGFLVHVAWCAIPISHSHVLTNEDWEFLMKKNVTPIFPQNPDQYPKNENNFMWWCRYPTTTPDMIVDIYSKMKTLNRVTRDLNYFLLKCPTLSHEQTVDILKSVNATDDLQQYEEMWYSVLKKLHKKYDLR